MDIKHFKLPKPIPLSGQQLLTQQQQEQDSVSIDITGRLIGSITFDLHHHKQAKQDDFCVVSPAHFELLQKISITRGIPLVKIKTKDDFCVYIGTNSKQKRKSFYPDLETLAKQEQLFVNPCDNSCSAFLVSRNTFTYAFNLLCSLSKNVILGDIVIQWQDFRLAFSLTDYYCYLFSDFYEHYIDKDFESVVALTHFNVWSIFLTSLTANVLSRPNVLPVPTNLLGWQDVDGTPVRFRSDSAIVQKLAHLITGHCKALNLNFEGGDNDI